MIPTHGSGPADTLETEAPGTFRSGQKNHIVLLGRGRALTAVPPVDNNSSLFSPADNNPIRSRMVSPLVASGHKGLIRRLTRCQRRSLPLRSAQLPHPHGAVSRMPRFFVDERLYDYSVGLSIGDRIHRSLAFVP